ncbi:MAG TPA: acyltransferase [Noviherbaspirillum sp.]|nr:acyltransferase [Noviherbaspirillum sp.]
MIRSLEGMRGIAALIVALYHLGIGAQHVAVIRNGYLFVDLFFVLSGFIMCAAYGRRLTGGEDLRVFLIRRIGRLFPLLVFSTLAFILAANAVVFAKRLLLERGYGAMLHNPDGLQWVIPTASEILATVTLTHSMGVFDDLILNTPSWSISVEFWAYVLFALLCLGLTGRNRLMMFGAVSVVAAVITVWASVTVHQCLVQRGCLSLTYDFGFPRAVFSFFLGALAFYASRHVRGMHGMLQAASLVLLAVVFLVVDHAPGIAFILPLVFALLILSVCSDEGPMSSLLRPRFFQLLGLWSYSIYLMHMPLLLFFENLSRRFDGLFGGIAVMASFVAVLLAVSAWTYRYVEDPMRAWFNRMAVRREVPAGSTNL